MIKIRLFDNVIQVKTTLKKTSTLNTDIVLNRER